METIFATAEAKKALEQRLADLISRRADVANQIKAARDFGDLKENAEYAAAREAQNNLEMEIGEIEVMIPNIKLFTFAKADTAKVNIGTRVKAEIVGKKQTVEFVIVGTLDSDIDKGWISNVSPIGRALLGLDVGDVAEVKTSVTKIKYKIISISKVS